MSEAPKNSLLIVDDEAANLSVLTHILSPEYTIYTAKNGPDAIKIAKEYLPDLVLLDIIMPGMNGYEVLSTLKSMSETQHIRTIFITGLSSSKDEEKGLSYKAVDYISKPFSDEIVKLRVRNQIQIVNQLRTIENMSMTDQLTGVDNRRSFDSRFDLEWGRAARDKSSLSVLIIDVDRFKIYNDTHGHQQGDAALQAVAKILSQSLKRQTDFAARWGGEEFAVLLPNTDRNGACEVAETIRVGIEDAVIPTNDGKSTRLTVSIGANTQVPEQGSDREIFISGADDALYTAKKTGRNMVVHASDAPVDYNPAL